jgi:diguanylate cyclase (GGDEF)-like protein
VVQRAKARIAHGETPSETHPALEMAETRRGTLRHDLARLRVENRRLRQSLEAACERAAAAQRIARHDGLTGLPNRIFLIERLQRAVAAAAQRSHRLALLFIDLDGFKAVNDGFGHAVADHLLAAVASRIKACVRTEDIACRYGGDEFVAMLTNLRDSSIAIGVAQKVREHIAGSYTIDGNDLRITASIGLAIYPEHGDQWSALLSHADAAMYHDKFVRRGCRGSVHWLTAHTGLPAGTETIDSASARNGHMNEMLATVIDERNPGITHVGPIES